MRPLISSSQIMGVLYVDSLERPFGFRRFGNIKDLKDSKETLWDR